VATGKPLRSIAAARVASWFFIPGTFILVWGMMQAQHTAMALGGAAAAIGLLLFTILVGELLWHARAMQAVSRFGLTAMAALIVTLLLGLAFIVDDEHGMLAARYQLTGIHVIAAIFGFMGMLAVGFSHVLIPLFTLAQGPPGKESTATFALALAALAGAIAGIYGGWHLITAASALVALAAAVLHIRSMERCLRAGMRKSLGVSILLIRCGWAALVVTLLVGGATAAGWLDAHGLRLTVYIALFGWLLTFLLGVLQRILPFLGSMNATGAGGKPPRPSELAPDKLLQPHAVLHGVAILLTGAGIGLENTQLVRFGGVAGLIGALIFFGFALRIWWLIHGPRTTS